MTMRILGLGAIALTVLLVGGGERASAITASCSSEYTTANGATTLASAPNIGTVQAGCEIGPYFSTTTGVGTNLGNTPAAVNDTNNPSIYEFNWAGGNLTIQEALGNNGIGNNINVRTRTEFRYVEFGQYVEFGVSIQNHSISERTQYGGNVYPR